jgi:hypothetical protein
MAAPEGDGGIGGYYTHPHSECRPPRRPPARTRTPAHPSLFLTFPPARPPARPADYCDQSRTSFTRFVYAQAGEPYVAAGSSKLVPERWKGKKLSVPVRDADFSKATYVPEPYTGGVIKYLGSEQAAKWTYSKPAFASKDFSKTDEFSGYSRMVMYREQVAKELKVAEGALQAAAQRALQSTSGSGEGSQRLPAFSPMKARGGGGGGGEEGGEGSGRGGASGSGGLGGSPPKPRASPTQFDRNRDIRDPKDVYRMTGIYKISHPGMDFKAGETSSMDYAEGLPTPEEMRLVSSPNKRVAVTKQFVRANGAWAAVTGKMP